MVDLNKLSTRELSLQEFLRETAIKSHSQAIAMQGAEDPQGFGSASRMNPDGIREFIRMPAEARQASILAGGRSPGPGEAEES